MSRRRGVVAAAAVLAALIALNTAIVIREKWSFRAIPHTYLYSALQHYHGRFLPWSEPAGFYFPSQADSDNEYSVLYFFSDLFARIGEPTPPWFRLAGAVMFAAVFFLGFAHFPRGTSPTDRLLTATVVATTPVVLYLGRYLEDHLVHVALLLTASMFLVRSGMGRRRSIAWPFYLVPAAGVVLTHMATNYTIMMMSYAGMAAYSIYDRRKELAGARALAAEAAAWLAAGVAWLGAFALRWDPEMVKRQLGYYRSAGLEEGAGPLVTAATLLAYPEVLVLSICGAVLCALALLNGRRAWRTKNTGLYLMWIAVPLVLLSISRKNNTYYIWYTAPAVVLLAAGVLRRLPERYKLAAVAACLLSAGLHWTGPISPLERWLNPDYFQNAIPYTLRTEFPFDPAPMLADARVIHKTADACSVPGGRAIAVLSDRWPSYYLYFAMLGFEPTDRFWFEMVPVVENPADLIVIEPADPARHDRALAGLEPYKVDWYRRYVDTHPEGIVVGDYRVRCGTR